MPRRRPVEFSMNHERWLVSYSDFITLLFAFFVVMYSISQVSESKYRVLSETLTSAFTEQMPLMTLNPLNMGEPARESKPSVIPSGGEHEVSHNMTGDGAFDRTADLPQLSDLFEQEFADLIEQDRVQIHSNELWLELELNSNVLFDSAEAVPTREAVQIFESVASILAPYNNPVQVAGFTDNVPISNQRFPSNWELSAARAATGVKLLAAGGVAPQRLSAVGHGEFQPIADNATEEGRAANRRVVVMISREAAERPRVKDGDLEQFVEPIIDASQTTETAVEAQENSIVEETAPIDPERTRLDPVGEIKPVETQSGGLLFSSDPDLPRGSTP